MNDKTETHKLGKVEDQPNTSKFSIRRRMPGWWPDSDPANPKKGLFPEEMIFAENAQYFAFPTPETPGGNPFDEPGIPASDADRLKYNQWILGGPIFDKVEPEPPLSTVVRELAVLARNYNASLYWMRRLHFHETDAAGKHSPPPNPHGPLEETASFPPLTDPKFSKAVQAAEEVWAKACKAIDDYLGSPHLGLENIRIDAVEVNGYIVSLRVLARSNLKEVGGSSSSHVSVSSPFSSWFSSP